MSALIITTTTTTTTTTSTRPPGASLGLCSGIGRHPWPPLSGAGALADGAQLEAPGFAADAHPRAGPHLNMYVCTYVYHRQSHRRLEPRHAAIAAAITAAATAAAAAVAVTAATTYLLLLLLLRPVHASTSPYVLAICPVPSPPILPRCPPSRLAFPLHLIILALISSLPRPPHALSRRSGPGLPLPQLLLLQTSQSLTPPITHSPHDASPFLPSAHRRLCNLHATSVSVFSAHPACPLLAEDIHH